MTLNQMTRTKRRAQRDFTSKNTNSDDTCEFPCVVARVCRMRTTNTEHVKHSRLRLEDCAAAESTDFDRGHGDGNLEIAIEAVIVVSKMQQFLCRK